MTQSISSDVQPALPDEHIGHARARDVALVTLLPLLLLLLLDLAVAFVLEAHPSNRGYAITRQKWQLLAELRAPVDTLVLGDSSCNQGVQPEVISKRFGGRTLNLCTTGDSLAVGDAWMAGAYVERWGAPKRFVVMHAYDVWERDDEALRKQAWVFGAQRGLFLGRAPELRWSVEERVLLHVGALLPLYTQPESSGELLLHPAKTLARPPLAIDADGFMATQKAVPKRVSRDASQHVRAHAGRRFAMSAPNVAALAELSRLSREHAVPLLVAHSPLYDGLWKNSGLRSYHGEVSDRIASALAGAPLARLLSRTPQTFAASQMENADHLVGEAVRTFTERLCDAMALALAESSSTTRSPSAAILRH